MASLWVLGPDYPALTTGWRYPPLPATLGFHTHLCPQVGLLVFSSRPQSFQGGLGEVP